MRGANSCPRPSYTRVLGSDLLAGFVGLAGTVIGGGAGYVIGRSVAVDQQRGGLAGALIGSGVGFLGGFYPSMMAQRAVLRSPDCPSPSMARIFGYRAASTAATGALAYTMRALMPDKCAIIAPVKADGTLVGAGETAVCKTNLARGAVTATIATFGLPLLGKAMLKGD